MWGDLNITQTTLQIGPKSFKENLKETGIWKAVTKELDDKRKAIQDCIASQKEVEPEVPFLDTEVDYLEREMFPQLLPALEKVLQNYKKFTIKEQERIRNLKIMQEIEMNKLEVEESLESYVRNSIEENENSCVNETPEIKFDAILELANMLWKNNPRFPDRSDNWENIEDALKLKTESEMTFITPSLSEANVESKEFTFEVIRHLK